jgi:hypothetical protein
MIGRASMLIVALALLTACGGGNKGSSLPPTGSAPQAKKIGTATFTLKIPSSSTMTKLRRRYYQSQATQGVAIDWTSSNPYAPDYSAPISATCPVPTAYPLGVTSCAPDPVDGGTDYSFQLQIPSGSYPNFTVTTFDAAPVSGAFPSAPAANMLAQGQLAAPVVITGGTSNTIPNLTFYGIPASVSFQPGPSQAHVTTYNGTIAVIGNMPQTFFAQAEDADGFVIDSTDAGAPTVTVAEASSDSPQYFNVATTSSAYEFTLTAESGSAGSPAQMVLTATPGGTGLAPISEKVAVTPVQEMWTTQAGGTGLMGIVGSPLYPPSYTLGAALDYANPVLAGCDELCNWSWAAMAPNGTIWVYEQTTHAIWVFTQGPGSQGVLVPASPSTLPLGASPQAFTIDSNGLIYTTDTSSGDISIFNSASPSTALVSFPDSPNFPYSIAVAPNAPNVPAALVGTIWVADSSNISVYNRYTSGAPASIPVSGAPGSAGGLAFDSKGNLWVYDPDDGNLDVYSISGSNSSAFMGLVAQTSLSGDPAVGSNQLGITAQGTGWMGGPGSLNGIYSFTLSGSTLSSGTLYSNNVPSVWSVMIAP